MKNKVVIANAGGYWGDDPDAITRQLSFGKQDYITLDFLAETTMSVMQKIRAKNASGGFAHDFILMLRPSLRLLIDSQTKIIASSGGVNPIACAEEVLRLASELGVKVRLAVVYGDDILAEVPRLIEKSACFDNLETGEKLSTIGEHLSAANVYLGASPIAQALRERVDIVITGRVVDAALVLGPLIYEFGWDYRDWDRLASAVVAGHVLECGGQASGGNFTDWHKVRTFDDLGFPVAEVKPSGEFTVTKHQGTGGLVSVDTVREQLLYEISDPKAYLTPDVVCDFTSILLHGDGPDRVKVSGVKGHEPTDSYKVSMAYDDGYKCSGQILISGPDAVKKGSLYADIFWKRCPKLDETLTEFLGLNAFGDGLSPINEPNEIALRLSAKSHDKALLRRFAKLLPSFILSGPPGVTFSGGTPEVHDVVSYWPALVSKDIVVPSFTLLTSEGRKDVVAPGAQKGKFVSTSKPDSASSATLALKDTLDKLAGKKSVPLSQLCLGRSGDKGDSVNIGILARDNPAYAYLKQKLTAQTMKNICQGFCKGRVLRYELDNILGINFVLEKALSGGGMRTLRMDALGKGIAQVILQQQIETPEVT